MAEFERVPRPITRARHPGQRVLYEALLKAAPLGEAVKVLDPPGDMATLILNLSRWAKRDGYYARRYRLKDASGWVFWLVVRDG